ncbi:exodeoxyribonuclease VII small subunit [Sphingobacterium oryzagri]|uniref:Exodeoxyribonuclease 7 small subunit n=1 Tax=Sphingobacterium oryzagri TaxID=3025669 RepID=A0ABY7WJ64_9SPHI|nr:exodeoxyribonuclease VII small subunit [Sphingobacterium sp. KACC 22765]WDF68607.1 exodeoxyribonuclease VII small subunit [Sphingobacterium sp. KACC 22765]
MDNSYGYEDAFQELQAIVNDIESGETNVDELTEKIQRAAALIAICKAKLTASEAEVDKLLAKLTADDDMPADNHTQEEE